MIGGYVTAAAAVAVLALGGYAYAQKSQLDTQREISASLQRSVSALEAERDAAKLAREVARAEAERFRVKSQEYDALRETLLKGENDAPLPDWFRSYLASLLTPSGAGVLDSPG
jgi:predicted negative regulator of RcsB-dependent stress response